MQSTTPASPAQTSATGMRIGAVPLGRIQNGQVLVNLHLPEAKLWSVAGPIHMADPGRWPERQPSHKSLKPKPQLPRETGLFSRAASRSSFIPPLTAALIIWKKSV